jgi:restriction system protein
MKLDLPIMQIWASALKITWPFLLAVAAIVAVKWFLIIREKRELAKSGIDQIDKMGGKEFEKYLEVLFEKLGYKVERTRYIGDYGADLVTSKDGTKTVIQAKRHKGKVGIKAVQEAVASKGHYGCEEAMVVTNSSFTSQAKRLASSNGVALWDRRELARAMNSMDNGGRLQPFNVVRVQDVKGTASVAAPSENRTVCAICGKAVSEKVRDYCMNHQLTFGGRIYCYDHQRQV